MARASVEDPIKAFRYRVIVDGFQRAGFSEATGLAKRKTEQVKYREGGFNETVQKSAGLTEFPDVTLTRGVIIGSSRGGTNDMVDWGQEVFDVASSGNASNYRRDLDVQLYNAQNVQARVWRIYECWPSEVDGMSDLKGESSENVVEKLVLANEGNEVIQ